MSRTVNGTRDFTAGCGILDCSRLRRRYVENLGADPAIVPQRIPSSSLVAHISIQIVRFAESAGRARALGLELPVYPDLHPSDPVRV